MLPGARLHANVAPFDHRVAPPRGDINPRWKYSLAIDRIGNRQTACVPYIRDEHSLVRGVHMHHEDYGRLKSFGDTRHDLQNRFVRSRRPPDNNNVAFAHTSRISLTAKPNANSQPSLVSSL